MKKIKIMTPENIEVEYTLADIGSRLAAAAVDMLIQYAIIIILGIAIFLILSNVPELLNSYTGWVIGIAIVLFALITEGYYIITELTMNGRTPGKKLLKLRTIRVNGQPITLKHSAIRNLFKLFIDVYGIGAVMLFFTKEHRRLGDFVASTIVVAEGSKDAPVTLESLQRIGERLGYYMTRDEYELVREYFQRKAFMKDHKRLQEELRMYFTQKFQNMGTLGEWKEFINDI